MGIVCACCSDAKRFVNGSAVQGKLGLTIPPRKTPELVALFRLDKVGIVCVPFFHRKGPVNSGLEITTAP